MNPISGDQNPLDDHERRKELTTFLTAMISSVIASFFFSETGIIVIGLTVYIGLRFLQRGPWSDI